MTLFTCQNHVNKLSQHYTRSFKTNQSALFDVRVPSRQLRCCTLLTVVTMTPSTVWISLHNRSNIFLSLHRNHSELNSFIICHPIYRAYRPIEVMQSRDTRRQSHHFGRKQRYPSHNQPSVFVCFIR